MDIFRWLRSSGAALGLAGPAAAVLFGMSVLGFAMAREDGYSHGTKAVSELGASGAPLAVAFNVLGFVIPGLLVILLAVGMAAYLQRKVGQFGLASLMLSGFAMVVAGVFPVDMAERDSVSSVLHVVGAMWSGVFWAASLFGLGPALRSTPGLVTLGRATPWFVVFLLLNIAWQVAYGAGFHALPGWGQRIAFLGYFAWLLWAGLAIWSLRAGAEPPAGRMVKP